MLPLLANKDELEAHGTVAHFLHCLINHEMIINNLNTANT